MSFYTDGSINKFSFALKVTISVSLIRRSKPGPEEEQEEAEVVGQPRLAVREEAQEPQAQVRIRSLADHFSECVLPSLVLEDAVRRT